MMKQMTESPPSPARRLGDVEAVADLCSWSTRTVLRAADAGLMPAGFKIGGLRRWDLKVIEEWIAAGCPRVRTLARKGGRP
jgi:hypothetical protein